MNDFDKLPEVKIMRERTIRIMDKLRCGAKDGINTDHVDEKTREFQRIFFHQHGFLVIQDFVNAEVVQCMKSQMKQLVDSLWEVTFEDDGGNEDRATSSNEVEASVFRTDDKQEEAQGSNEYFLQSATEIHFFAEKDAMSEICRGRLKTNFYHNKVGALNKCGHGIHLRPTFTTEIHCGSTTAAVPQKNIFHSYATSPSLRHLVMDILGYVNPVIPQSMYIFKQPFVGSEVTSHQDSTFLFTYPKQTCLGLWLALDDSTVENGCLWVRPGSQTEPLRRKFVRNPEYFNSNEILDKIQKPLMIFENLVNEADAAKAPWEGSLPNASWPPPCTGLFESGFVPVECKAGDLVVFSGLLDHLSLPNYSCKQRHTFQLHLVEGGPIVNWAESNWLQYPVDRQFLGLKDCMR